MPFVGPSLGPPKWMLRGLRSNRVCVFFGVGAGANPLTSGSPVSPAQRASSN